MIKKIFKGTLGMAVNVVIYALVIFFAIRMVTYAYDFSYQLFGDPPVAEESVEKIPVQIPEGAGTQDVAALLKAKGLIKYEKAFVTYTGMSQYKGQIKPGNYELSKSMNMEKILQTICGVAPDSGAQG